MSNSGRKRERHGMSDSAMYFVWANMIQRCINPKHEKYPDYGGRGITVCDRWRTSFAAFYADMGQQPSGMSIERDDNSKGYEPSNCRWATAAEQSTNKRIARNNTTGVSGVEWRGKQGLFVVYSYRPKRQYLGSTKDLFDAVCLRKSAEARFADGRV